MYFYCNCLPSVAVAQIFLMELNSNALVIFLNMSIIRKNSNINNLHMYKIALLVHVIALLVHVTRLFSLATVS